jgi:hypothetical protein
MHGNVLVFFYRDELLAPTQPEMSRHPLSAVSYCLFSVYANALHMCKPSRPLATEGQGTQLRRSMQHVQNYIPPTKNDLPIGTV